MKLRALVFALFACLTSPALAAEGDCNQVFFIITHGVMDAPKLACDKLETECKRLRESDEKFGEIAEGNCERLRWGLGQGKEFAFVGTDSSRNNMLFADIFLTLKKDIPGLLLTPLLTTPDNLQVIVDLAQRPPGGSGVECYSALYKRGGPQGAWEQVAKSNTYKCG